MFGAIRYQSSLLKKFKKGVIPVAHHKSAIKRHRQNEKRRLQNRVVKTRMKTVTKKLVQAEKSGDSQAILNEFIRAKSAIDKAAKKGVIHPNTASRKKSRLAKSVNKTVAA
jgi:small subunit ribosomal protein S20